MSRFLTWLPDWDHDEWNNNLAGMLRVAAYFGSWVTLVISLIWLYDYVQVYKMEGYPGLSAAGPILFLATLVAVLLGGGALLAETYRVSAVAFYMISAVFFGFPYLDASYTDPISEGQVRVDVRDGTVYEAGVVAPRGMWEAKTVPITTMYDIEHQIPNSSLNASGVGTSKLFVRIVLDPQSADFKTRILSLLKGEQGLLSADDVATVLQSNVEAHASAIYMPVVQEKMGASIGQVLHSENYPYISAVIVKAIRAETTYGTVPTH